GAVAGVVSVMPPSLVEVPFGYQVHRGYQPTKGTPCRSSSSPRRACSSPSPTTTSPWRRAAATSTSRARSTATTRRTASPPTTSRARWPSPCATQHAGSPAPGRRSPTSSACDSSSPAGTRRRWPTSSPASRASARSSACRTRSRHCRPSASTTSSSPTSSSRSRRTRSSTERPGPVGCGRSDSGAQTAQRVLQPPAVALAGLLVARAGDDPALPDQQVHVLGRHVRADHARRLGLGEEPGGGLACVLAQHRHRLRAGQAAQQHVVDRRLVVLEQPDLPEIVLEALDGVGDLASRRADAADPLRHQLLDDRLDEALPATEPVVDRPLAHTGDARHLLERAVQAALAE